MSSGLVRQALEFVDQDNDKPASKKRRNVARFPGDTGQGFSHPYRKKGKKISKKEVSVEENIEKLLALSKPVADSALTSKIIKRAIVGKPLLEKIEVKKEEEKSILFPEEETFEEFEDKYFCS